MVLDEDNPKLFSEFCLTFTASDDYRVVSSRHEILNIPAGNHLFLVTEKEASHGKK